jgi:hypothetical protein
MSNRAIAQKLVIEQGTIANHVAHILAKCGVSNRTQVAALFLCWSGSMSGDAGDLVGSGWPPRTASARQLVPLVLASAITAARGADLERERAREGPGLDR